MSLPLPVAAANGDAAARQQRAVDAYFRDAADYWRDLYQEERLLACIYRERQERALAWIAELELPAGADLLEVGCGAGGASVELARRGFRVEATDPSTAMRERTRLLAAARGLEIGLGAADVHDLPYAPESFDLVLALGVLPWLHTPALALRQMAAVLRPGGALVLSADHRWRLDYLLDPRATPPLAPLRRRLRRLLVVLGAWRQPATAGTTCRHSRREVTRLLRGAGLAAVRETTIGFGPFTFAGRRLLSDAAGRQLHRRLQALADRGAWPLAGRGQQLLVMARKPAGPTVAARS